MRPEIVLYWLCGWALWLAEIHRKDICHLVFGSPLLIILCIYYLEQYRTKIADLALQVLAISAACLAGFNLFLVLSARPLAARVGSVAVFKNVPVLALLDDKVAPGEEIFAYPYCPMYYFLSATTNPTRYGALVYNFDTPLSVRGSNPGLRPTPRKVRAVGHELRSGGGRHYLPRIGTHAA